ncbi:hypothetical protein [Nocardioides sp.]|uniref:hypothetical protein n=1 Tax=Nocardioides sp. TaxID=35761 RepID=UPI00351540BF
MSIAPRLLAATAASAVLFTASPALAASWGTITAYDGGVAQGHAYGNFYNNNRTVAQSTSHFMDARPGGDKVRVETDFWWFGPDATCGDHTTACWWHDTSKQSQESNTGQWEYHTVARALRAGDSKARGAIDICEIQSWSNDPCSKHAVVSFAY